MERKKEKTKKRKQYGKKLLVLLLYVRVRILARVLFGGLDPLVRVVKLKTSVESVAKEFVVHAFHLLSKSYEDVRDRNDDVDAAAHCRQQRSNV